MIHHPPKLYKCSSTVTVKGGLKRKGLIILLLKICNSIVLTLTPKIWKYSSSATMDAKEYNYQLSCLVNLSLRIDTKEKFQRCLLVFKQSFKVPMNLLKNRNCIASLWFKWSKLHCGCQWQ